MKAPEKESYSIAEAAKFLGVGRSTLYRMIAAGKINTVKIGKRTIITTHDLAAILGNDRIHFMTRKGLTCPACGSNNLDPVGLFHAQQTGRHANKDIKVIRFKVYRCKACQKHAGIEDSGPQVIG